MARPRTTPTRCSRHCRDADADRVRAQEPGENHAEPEAEPEAQPDRVPGAHRSQFRDGGIRAGASDVGPEVLNRREGSSMARRTGVIAALAVVGALVVGAIATIAVAQSGNRFDATAHESELRGSRGLEQRERELRRDAQQQHEHGHLRAGRTRDLESDVRQAHIHFAQSFASAGISVWLCETTFNPAPAAVAAATPDCPAGRNGNGQRLVQRGRGDRARRAGHRRDGVQRPAGRDACRQHLRQRPLGDDPGRRDPRPAPLTRRRRR